MPARQEHANLPVGFGIKEKLLSRGVEQVELGGSLSQDAIEEKFK